MNPIVGWGLAVAGVAAGWWGYGWQGVVMAISVIVFWLLLQFSRALQVMKKAATAPIGHVDSAVMLNAQLKPGMTFMRVIALTRSLGCKVTDTPEVWVWNDAYGASVALTLEAGKLTRWELTRAGNPP